MIIGGFLGSGKTTLLLNVVKKMIAQSKKIAVVENEIGEIGIDGNYLKKEGLTVQELFGGCICCTLTAGLIETLQKIETAYHPDLVIIEATGAARPGDIVTTLHDDNCPLRFESIKVVTVVDVTRYEMLIQVMEPLLTGQIQRADIVAVNKIDEASIKQIDRIIECIAKLNPSAAIVAMSAEEEVYTLNPFMELL